VVPSNLGKVEFLTCDGNIIRDTAGQRHASRHCKGGSKNYDACSRVLVAIIAIFRSLTFPYLDPWCTILFLLIGGSENTMELSGVPLPRAIIQNLINSREEQEGKE
jgi:hypothetical protein